MRAIFTTLFLSLGVTALWAQPSNNDCTSAQTVTLSTPSCTSTTTSTVSGNNNDATPSTPFPSFNGCDVGGQTADLGADVWYTFVATGNTVEISMSGLTGTNIVLFDGDNCAFLVPIECASGNGAVLTGTTFPGNTYYIAVYGNGVDDQGNFTLTITSSRDCNACYTSENITLIANPPPVNGTYNSGQSVNFCLTINQWNVTGTIEWLHAVAVGFGPGWNYPGSFIPQPPPSCDGAGSWNWYANPWVGCNTGQFYGPGFAYDSASGVGCGGSPNDGDPGNNWGDGGNGCANIGQGSPPVQFCWTIEVGGCPPNMTGNDLGINVEIFSDGDSGSWNQTGCNSGVDFDILATVVCCDDFDPLAMPFNTSCPGENDGYIEMQGSGGIDPFATYDFTVFDANNNIVFTCNACSGTVITNQDLAPGAYTVLATNVATGCNRSSSVIIEEGMPPVATASVSNMPCPGDPAFLMGDVSPFDPFVTYTWFWTGPNNFSSTEQNPQVFDAGTYTLTVSANGCDGDPVSVDVEFVVIDAQAFATPNPVCQDQQVELFGSGGLTYEWENITTTEYIGFGNPAFAIVTQPSTYRVTVTDDNGCTETAEVFVDMIFPPVIQVDIFPDPICAGDVTSLTASGAGPGGTYLWLYNNQSAQINPLVFNEGELAAGDYSFTVVGTDVNGCQAETMVDFSVFEVPTAGVMAQDPVICAGESTLLSATGNGNYLWSTNESGVNNITVSPVVTTEYMVTVVNAGGCEDVASVTVQVEDPVAAPQVSCGTITPNSVEFIWNDVPGAIDYSVTVNTGQTGTQAGNTYTFDNLSPGEVVTITVTANTLGACPPSSTQFTCAAEDCPPLTVTIDPVAPICLDGTDQSFDLQFMTNGNGGSVIWTGNGIINANSGTFDPAQAGVGDHTITLTYTEGECPYQDEITIAINATPTADFTLAPTPVCTDTDVTITYTGTATTAATYNWDFGSGTIQSGSGAGPYTVQWANGGSQTVTLSVTENGCTSPANTQTVDVSAPLTPPTITCGTATSTSVEFNWAAVSGATGYNVTTSGPTGTLAGTTYTIDNLTPGQSVTITVEVTTDNVCGPVTAMGTCTALDCPDYTIVIDPVGPLCSADAPASIDLTATVSGGDGSGTLTWSGPGVTGNTFDPAVAGTGDHTITATYTEGPCTEMATSTISIVPTPTADFTATPAEVCIGQTVTITHTGVASNSATFDWNFAGGTVQSGTGAGPYTVSWPTAGMQTITLTVTDAGCASTPQSQSVTVSEPLADPMITCTSTTSSITFSWADISGAVDYQINVIAGPAGTQAGNSYTVTDLDPGEEVTIELVAVGDGPCGNSSVQQTCAADDCPTDVVITIDPLADICLTATAGTVDLNATVTGGAGNGNLTWSGTGVSGTTFDPQTAGVGMYTLTATYVEDNCTYTEAVDVNVFAVPTADFAVSNDDLCINEATSVTYTGSAGTAATYTWNFDGGTIVSGSNAGPYEINWATAGAKLITLTVTENGCVSEQVSQTVDVSAPLVAPVINCSPTTTTITFSWADVPGAVDYQVTVLAGPAGTQSGNTYTVGGLSPGDAVEIEVTAIGDGPCGNSTATLECVAEDCPDDVVITIDPLAAICLDASAMPVALMATVTGGAGGGTQTWSGPGVSGTTFDPQVAGVGMHTLTLTYQEGNCPYNETITVDVFAIPTAAFTVTPETVCIDEPVTISYTGTGGTAATFDWSFSGGTVLSGTGSGPYQVSWPTAGMPTITLTVTENGCVSEVVTNTVTIEESIATPTITCETTNTSITFSWMAIDGATGYDVAIVDAPAGTMGTLSGTSYSITDLVPGDMVTISVTTQTDNTCGPTTAQATCTASDCAMGVWDIPAIGPLCADDAAVMVTGELIIDDLVFTSGFTLSGPGTLPDGTFDPTAVGPGTYTVCLNYNEDVCDYQDCIDIEVVAPPVADFEVDLTEVCVGQPLTVTFTGTASANATYTWSFDGGMANPATGPGPIEVSWDDAGTGSKVITLMVTDGDCVSDEATFTVVVTEPLEPLQVTCVTTSTTEVTFGWNDVAGATDYTVTVLSGPMGTQAGNTYTMTGLSPGDAVEIMVTAETDNVCGPVSGSAICIAQDCQPLTLTLDGPAQVCADDDATISFDIAAATAGPFVVTYTLDSGPEQTVTVTNGESITLPGLTADTEITVVSIQDSSLPDCTYPGNATLTVLVIAEQSAGTAAAPFGECVGIGSTVVLADLLEGEDAGGTWTETSVSPSSGGFNAVAGTFQTANESAGTYTFLYTIGGSGSCPESSTEVTVNLDALPTADAGTAPTLTCNMGMVTLGGSGTTAGATYLWTVDNPTIIIQDSTQAMIEVSAPGTYTLLVTNAAGCTAESSVTVDSESGTPIGQLSLSEISCFEANDGAIIISDVTGGQPPYSYSLNSGAAVANPFFGSLSPGDYSVVITDANGCFSELAINLTQPEQVVVTLTTNLEGTANNVVEAGRPVTLSALYSSTLNIDTIIWNPDSLGVDSSIQITPIETAVFGVTIVDVNGCSDSDNITLIVEKTRPVYIPTAFSPDGDGNNDIFFIQGDGRVIEEVQTLMLFNRWGESVFAIDTAFPINNPDFGWDGTHREQPVNSGVYVYYTKVKFTDGEVVEFMGDVTVVH